MSNPLWDLLVDRIEEEKCTLIIGPELCTNEREESFQEVLNQYLEKRGYDELGFFSEDEFFSFKDEIEKQYTYYEIKTFFEDQKIPDIYYKIAQIPFHLIVSLSPDLYLKTVFEEKNINHTFAFYHKSITPAPIKNPPSRSSPLLYNLLGNMEDEESLVFTYEDLFDYIERVFGGAKLPDTLRAGLRESKNFVFLGIKYERWYLKLILRLLNLHRGKINNAFIKKSEVIPTVKQFYTKQFKINFVETGVDDFIENLFQKCQHLLRPVDGKTLPIASEKEQLMDIIRRLVIKGDFDRALKTLEDHTESQAPEHVNEVAMIQGSWNDIKQILIDGIKTKGELTGEIASIRKSILILTEKVS